MFSKKSAYFNLAIALVISLVLILLRPTPEFDYDFEQFFPQDDPDLEFYEVFKSSFESDNDYLLFAIENDQGPWLESKFIDDFLTLQNSLSTISGVDTTVSILSLQQPVIGVFGTRWRDVVRRKDSNQLDPNERPELNRFLGSLISKDGESFLLIVKNEQQITKEEGDGVYGEILEKFAQAGITPKAVAGKIQAQGDFVKLMESEFGQFLAFSFLLILIVLALIYRSWSGVLIPILVLAIGIAWAFGLIILGGRKLDVMSVMQPTIFLIVGMSALIHFFTHLAKKFDGQNKNEIIALVFKELFVAVGLTILTTGLGFISLYFTSIPALKSFGLSTGLGVFVIFIAIVLITPGLLYLLPVSLGFKRSNSNKLLFTKGLIWVFDKRKSILYFSIIISLLSVVMGSQVKINGFLLDSLPKDHPIQKDLSYFDAQFGGSNPLEIYLEASNPENNLLSLEALREIEKIENELTRIFGVRELVSPLSYIKTLNQAQNQGDYKAFVFPSQGQFRRLKRLLSKPLNDDQSLFLSKDLRKGRISGRLPDLGSDLMTQKRKEFNQFIQQEIDSGIVQARWTGTAYLIDKGHQSVTWQMVKGLSAAFLLVGIVAGFLFKSWRISFILLIPNLIPLFLMAGLMFLLGIEFKLSTAILFSIAFGIAVDDSIHFMTRLKFELEKGKSLLYAIKRTFLETGFAIALTTLVLVSGFGLLMFSQFEVTYFTGMLISASLIFALLADLILLPVLLLPMKRVWESKNPKTN